MTEPIRSADPDPWAGSPSKRVDPAEQRRRSEAREMRARRLYGTYWAVVTVLLCISAVAGLVTGNLWGLLALLLAGGAGRYSRYLYRGGKVRIFIIPLP